MKSILGSGLFALLTIVGMTLLTQNLAQAASISCDNYEYTTSVICKGTTSDDVIKDGNSGRIIDGLNGNDNINWGHGDDDVCGSGGNDKIQLGNGDDRAIADGPLCGGGQGYGADTMEGGPGNDILAHASAWDIDPDGFKDLLDCGPGIDLAILNITIDHDEARNCEYINVVNAPSPVPKLPKNAMELQD